MNYLKTEVTQDDEGDGNWIFSFSDIMTLLLGFFVILYSFSKIDDSKFDALSQELTESFMGQEKSKGEGEGIVSTETRQVRALQLLVAMLDLGSTADEAVAKIESTYQQTQDFEKARDLIAGELSGSGRENLDKLKGDFRSPTNELEIILPANTLFLSGRYDLTPSARQGLESLGRQIVQAKGLVEVEVIGHTDSVLPGKSALLKDNFTLSAARAGAVASELISRGILENLIRVRGMGSLRPLFPEKDEQGQLLPDNQQKNRRVHIVLRRHPTGLVGQSPETLSPEATHDH